MQTYYSNITLEYVLRMYIIRRRVRVVRSRIMHVARHDGLVRVYYAYYTCTLKS